jgi:acetyltransferase-like isoleucine patch superfamily enzyme
VVPPTRIHNPHRIGLGRDVTILEHATLSASGHVSGHDGPVLTIGDGVVLARFCSILCEVAVSVGDRVAASDGATIVDTWQPLLGDLRPDSRIPPPDAAPVVIGPGAYLGMGCIIGPGVHVGEGAYVGENAVVWNDIPAHSVAYGNPAVVTRRYDEAGHTWEGRPWP